MQLNISPELSNSSIGLIDLAALTMPQLGIPGIRIELIRDESGKLDVHISTEHLRLRSVRGSDAENLYCHIYGSEAVMATFQNGAPWSQEHFQKRLSTWIARWEKGDPFSAYTISKAGRSGEFVGVAVMGHGSIPGRSELAFAMRQECWGEGYGLEAMKALVGKFAALLRADHARVKGEVFSEVEATVLLDNIPSIRILDALGMAQRSINDPLAATAAQYERARQLYVGEVRPLEEPSYETVLDIGTAQFFRSLDL